MRTTVTIGDELAAAARELGINMSAAARDGIAEAVRRARAEADRDAYRRSPEAELDDTAWDDDRPWS